MHVLQWHLPHILQPGNAGLFKSPGYGIHPDRTIDSYELIFVRSGTLELEEEGRIFRIHKGESLLLWPGKRHRGLNEYLSGLAFYWAHFKLDNPQLTGREITVEQHTRPQRPERILELYHRLLDEKEMASPDQPEAASMWIVMLLLETQRRDVTLPNANSTSALADKADHYITMRFDQGIHAGDVADALSCNRDYLARLYRAAYGCTISQSIHRRQLKKAAQLLRESILGIEEIATECGFNEVRYFRKLFAEQQGISARDYRKLHTRMHINRA